MATPIDDAIENLQTQGGTNSNRPLNFAGQSSITFFISANGNGGMTAAEVSFVRLAFKAWGDLIDIPLVETQDIAAADIALGYADLTVRGPAGVTTTFPIIDQKAILINRAFFVVGDTPTLGSTGFNTILHEIGHALGLSHPGPYNGDFFDDAVYGEDTTYPEDFLKFTVMSYFDLDDVESATGDQEAYWGTSFPWSPMLHDIAAIQSIYGANSATRAGDTVYGFNASNLKFTLGSAVLTGLSGSEGVFTIWDGGGIDTIDASGAVADEGVPIAGSFNEFPNQIIDLRQGAFSSIGLDRSVRTQTVLSDNIAIAFGTVIENAIGGGGDDLIIGNNEDNILLGGAGDDILRGGSGNDTLEGGLHGDVLAGGAGFDTASYAHAARGIIYRPNFSGTGIIISGDISGDTFSSIEAWELTPFGDIFEAFETDDKVEGGGGADQIFGLGGNDLLIGGADIDTLDGGADDDTLQGLGQNDILIGGSGNDTLDGGVGADRMVGRDGNDTYIVDNAGDTVVENFLNPRSGLDLVISSISFALGLGVENLTLVGPSPVNGTGTSLANTITGNSHSNTLDGGGGADTLIGRGGHDTYIVDNSGDVVDESTGSSTDIDTVLSSVTFNLSPLGSAQTRGAVENLTLTGAVAINGIGNSLDNILIGNSMANVLNGLEGADRLDGGGGIDTMFGGTGDDTYVVDNAADRADETGGAAADIDTVLSSVSFSLLNTVQARGNIENVTLTGNAAINATGNGLDNTLTSNAGSNVLTAGAGSDTYAFAGSFGNDTISDSSGSDKIVVTGKIVLLNTSHVGDDLVLQFSSGSITIDNHFTTGQVESLQVGSRTYVLANGLIGGDLPGIISGSQASEVMDGKGGDDLLYGGGGNDTLLGGLGNDLLDGGNGRDILDGGAGDDVLTGDRGSDSFVFKPGFGHDTITDFSLFEDRLDISGFHNRPGFSFSRSGSTLELDFGGGDTLSISFESGADHWRLPFQFERPGGNWFDF